ncbi:hypothetical protein [Ruegeria atlantica]|uniref:hypothetical protein n=1 Tax=Ruegeria atlantica TaxID=81569 RepID=UPI0024953C66|nr:hypothetical protein [Ruegeria atlantica]
MRISLLNLLVACTVAAGSGPVAADKAEPLEQRNMLDLARGFCGSEIDAVSAIDDKVLGILANNTGGLDPRVDVDQHSAFDKFAIGALANALQVGDMAVYRSHLANGDPISARMRNKSIALLDLVDCLWITQEDRAHLEEFVNWGIENGDFPSDMKVDQLLSATNMSECTRMREFDRRTLALDPDTPDIVDQVSAIAEDTIGRCEKES